MGKWWRFILVGLLAVPFMANAHNVLGGVYAIGSTIEGEIGFSNGDMAPKGTEIIVFDGLGNELGRVETDADGLFSFEATKRVDHFFYGNLSSGHVVDMTLPADQLPETLAGGEVGASQDLVSTTASGSTLDKTELETMIETAVAKQVKPLRQELAAYKEKAGLQDILGGIGYIFGVCGLGIWWRQRQKDQQSKTNASVS